MGGRTDSILGAAVDTTWTRYEFDLAGASSKYSRTGPSRWRKDHDITAADAGNTDASAAPIASAAASVNPGESSTPGSPRLPLLVAGSPLAAWKIDDLLAD